MGAIERYVYSSAGMREILKSGGVAADLGRRAGAVAASARAAAPSDVRITVLTNTGRVRAGATVIGVPMRLEARSRILGRAIDAARR